MAYLKKIITAIIFLGTVGGFVSETQAFTIAPARYELIASAGSTQNISVTVKNTESQTLRFVFSVSGARQDEHGRPRFGVGLDVAEQWAKPTIKQIELQPKKERKVAFTITVPKGIPSGAHYIGLNVDAQSTASTTRPIGLTARSVVLVTLRVAGMAHEQAQLEEWQSVERVQGKKLWSFVGRIKNTGNVEVPLKGLLTIKNSRGEKIIEQPFTLGNDLLPDTFRAVRPTVNFSKQRLTPGRYESKVEIIYGTTNQRAAASTTVYYLPWWFRAVVLAGLACVVGAIIAFLKFKRT